MLGPALLDDDRGDAIGKGASGYGVGMLVELVSRLVATLRRGGKGTAPMDAFIRLHGDDD
jgi:hypothetical protein